MDFRSAAWKITFRVILMVLTIFGAFYLGLYHDLLPALFLGLIVLAFQVSELIHFNLKTNEKLSRFFESIRYSDFSSSFTVDNKLGGSYTKLNQAFNEVIGEFRKTRLEKEEQVLFLQIILQHIHTGIISFDEKGNVGLINNAAKHLLQIPQFKNISDLSRLSTDLLHEVLHLRPGQGTSFKISPSVHLTIRSTDLKMGGRKWTLLSLQNINAELKQNELDAWQNLTKVLRHEIMNSIAPIATLVGSLRTVLKEDVYKQEGNYMIEKDGYADLEEGLETIENRSKGLITFVRVYREYTSIPDPVLSNFPVQSFLENIIMLLREDLAQSEIDIRTSIYPTDLQITADKEQIQMILINLIKNAKEALSDSREKVVLIQSGIDGNRYKFIKVTDFGPGIPPGSIDDVFVPFFTTKKEGSGIGLAISRQIMHLHKGSLHVHSVPNQQTTFTLQF